MDVSGLDYAAHMRLLRLRKAASLGIIVSDNMVKARLEQMFSNPNDQKFSQDAYTGFLTQYRNAGLLGSGKGGEEQFQELIREQITFQQLDNLMTRSVGFFADEATAGQQAWIINSTPLKPFSSAPATAPTVSPTCLHRHQLLSDCNRPLLRSTQTPVAYVLFPVHPTLRTPKRRSSWTTSSRSASRNT